MWWNFFCMIRSTLIILCCWGSYLWFFCFLTWDNWLDRFLMWKLLCHSFLSNGAPIWWIKFKFDFDKYTFMCVCVCCNNDFYYLIIMNEYLEFECRCGHTKMGYLQQILELSWGSDTSSRVPTNWDPIYMLHILLD